MKLFYRKFFTHHDENCEEVSEQDTSCNEAKSASREETPRSPSRRLSEELDRISEDIASARECQDPKQNQQQLGRLFHQRAVIYSTLERWEEALADLNRALEILSASSNTAMLLSERANVRGMLGDLEGCIADSTSALGLLETDANSGWASLTELHQQRSATLGHRGVAYRLVGRLDRALDDLTAAISLRPDDADLHLGRATVYRQLGQWNNMISDCTQAFKINPEDDTAVLMRAVAFAKVGNLECALNDCSEAIRRNPQSAKAYVNRALVHRLHGRWPLVIEDCTTALSLNPNDTSILSTRAVAYGNIGNLDQLVKDCNRILSIDSNFFKAYNNRGSAYLRLNKYAKAEEDFNKVLELDPGNSSALSQRSLARRKLGNLQGAEQDCTDLLARVQEDAMQQARALAARAVVRCQLQKWSGAIEDAGRAMLLDPTQGAQLNTLRKKALEIQEQEKKQAEKRAFDMSLELIAEEEREKAKAQSKTNQKNKGKSGGSERKNAASLQEATGDKKQPSSCSGGEATDDISCNSNKKKKKKKKKNSKGNDASAGDANEEVTSHIPEDVQVVLPNGIEIIEDFFKVEITAMPEHPTTNKERPAQGMMHTKAEQDETIPTPRHMRHSSDFNAFLPGPKVPELPFDIQHHKQEKEDTLFKRVWRSFKMFEVPKQNLTHNTNVPGPLDSKQLCLDILTLDAIPPEETSHTESPVESSSPKEDVDVESEIKPEVKVEDEPHLLRIGNLSFDTTKVIGTGSFGTKVFSGHHREWGPVAVKAMDLEQQPVSQDAGKTESAMHRMINRVQTHPNVVRYYGLEEDERITYLAIELCHCSLWEVFKKEGLQDQRAWFRRPDVWPDVVSQLVQGTSFLHSQNVVHGDLRPKNVLFDINGTLKLSDFGLSRKVEESDSSFSWTYGDPNGMGGWFAPEVYRRERKTMAVDIFSLGCVLYYILSDGQHPFNSNPFDVVTGKVDLHAIEDIHEALDLILSMLNGSAEKRPNIHQVGDHPFVWDLVRKLQYVEDISNLVDSKRIGKQQIDSIQIVPASFKCGPNQLRPFQDWISHIHPDLVSSVQRFRTYDSTSTVDLLRFIRNLNQHFADQTEEALQVLKPSTWEESEGNWIEMVTSIPKLQKNAIMKYFLEKVPSIIIKLWTSIGPSKRT